MVKLTSLLLLLIFGCASSGTYQNGYFAKREAHYRVGEIPAGFSNVHISGADIAWFHEQTGASILVNASCKKITDAPLEALSVHLSLGMTAENYISKQHIALDGRDALETVMTAKLDGVLQKFDMVVLKENGCVFDLILSSPPEEFEKAQAVFKQVIQAFHVEG